MSDGRGADGTPVLRPESLSAMRSDPGPGGTLIAEIDGYGVTLCLRRSAEGVTIVEHGGDYQGQHSGFLLVPERDFAITLLTNSSGDRPLKVELFYDDWALQRFACVHNPPAAPALLPPEQLAQYEGAYVAESIDQKGTKQRTVMTATGRDGRLQWSDEGDPGSAQTLTFYRDGRQRGPTSCAVRTATSCGIRSAAACTGVRASGRGRKVLPRRWFPPRSSPVFRPDGTVTAGNAGPLNDGASAVVITSDATAKELGLSAASLRVWILHRANGNRTESNTAGYR